MSIKLGFLQWGLFVLKARVRWFFLRRAAVKRAWERFDYGHTDRWPR